MVATQSFHEAGPAYESVRSRYPHRRVTLHSRSELMRDSRRPEYLFDG